MVREQTMHEEYMFVNNAGRMATAATATATSSATSSAAGSSSTMWVPTGLTEDHQHPVLEQQMEKLTHPEWGVMKEQDFHPLTLKHQRDLENFYETRNFINDFYFWQANLGGYCMANMEQNIVVSSEGSFVLERRIVDGAPHPGRRKKKQN